LIDGCECLAWLLPARRHIHKNRRHRCERIAHVPPRRQYVSAALKVGCNNRFCSRTRGTQTSTAKFPTALSDKPSFAEAGARLSFKNRSNNSLPTTPIDFSSQSSHETPAPTLGSHHIPDPGLKSIPKSIGPALATQNRQLPQLSSGPSGALKAAAMATNAHTTPTATGSSPMLKGGSRTNNIGRAGYREPHTSPPQNGSVAGAGLAAARASVSKPEAQSKEPKAFHLQGTNGLSLRNPVQTTPIISDHDRITAAASAAMVQSREASRTTDLVSKKAPPNLSHSNIAARSVSLNQTQSAPSVSPADRESKFGVILTRSASPAIDSTAMAIQNESGFKRYPSLYQLPTATVSEPTFFRATLEPNLSTESVHRVFPLIRAPVRPDFSDRTSSSGASSLADFGAATAMASRNSSAASLPTLLQAGNIDSLDSSIMGPVRSRPIHLKATMRKEHRHEKENKKQMHAASLCLSEAQRKRYEGVWASNHSPNLFSSSSDAESDFLSNLIVRELWTRSKLSRELLAHIWYIPNHVGSRI